MCRKVLFLGCWGWLALAAGHALGSDDLIDDLPKSRKEAAAKDARGERPSKKTERRVPQGKSDEKGFDSSDKLYKAFELQRRVPEAKPGEEGRLPLPNTDLVDDLSPEQKQAAAQRSAPEHLASAIPDNLGEALARALHNSPTVLVAEAKVRQAQAELNEVKLSVTHDMTLAFQRRAGSKPLMDVYTLHGERAEMEKVRQAILEDESRIIYLLGVGIESAERSRSRHGEGGMMPGGMMGGMMAGMGGGMMPGMAGKPSRPTPSKSPAAPPTTAAKPQSDLPEKFQKFLQAVTEFDFAEQPLSDVLEYLKQRHGGDVNFVGTEKLGGPDVTLSLKNITVEAGLQALADLTGHCFIFRDYGILVMHSKDAKSYLESGIPMIAPVLPTQTPDATKRRD